jgi:iron complex outermembrane receptor protein
MQSESVDLRGNVPKLIFSDADRAYLANPNNYYWAFTHGAPGPQQGR